MLISAFASADQNNYGLVLPGSRIAGVDGRQIQAQEACDQICSLIFRNYRAYQLA